MRRLLSLALLSLGLSSILVLAPTTSGATTHVTPTVAHEASGTVTRERVLTLPAPADFVAVYWQGNPHAHVLLAQSTDGTHFGPSVPAGRDELGSQRRNGTTYGAVQPAAGTVAVRVTTDRPLARVTVLGMSDGASTGQTRIAAAGAAAEAATAEPTVIGRAAWGADPALMTWAPQFYATKKLVVHHTDTSNDYTDRAGAEAQIRAIYYYHSVTQDWGDIGYNFLIDKFGNVYEGRYSREYAGANPTGDDATGLGVTGAHASGWNSGTVGIALLGTFTAQDVTPAARDALERLLAWEASRNGIDPQATQSFVNPVSGATITTPNIAGHRDYVATACPGETLYSTLPALRSAVAARIAGSPTPADTTAPSAPASLTAAGGKNRVTLGWKASTDNVGVAGYEVWRSRQAGSGFARVASTTATTYVNGSLARRTTYYFKVRAYDAAGNLGGFSTVAAARTS